MPSRDEYVLAPPDAESARAVIDDPPAQQMRAPSADQADSSASYDRGLLSGGPPPFTVKRLLLSPFVVAQTMLNVALSFAFPLLFFWFLFSPAGPIAVASHYAWDSSLCCGVIIASPLACAVIPNGLAPIGMPEAVAKGWFGTLRTGTARQLLQFFPPLRPCVGVQRHLILGFIAALVWIPAGFAVARFALTGPEGIPAWIFILFGPAYIATLPIALVPAGLLGLCAARGSSYGLRNCH